MADSARTSIVAQQLGANLRRLRQAADLSRDELANRSDVGHGHISKIERGELLCRVDTLVKLAVTLDATPNDLLSGIGWRRRGDRGGGFEVEHPGGGGTER